MPKFKLMIENLDVYGCTIEAADEDEANTKFEEMLEKTKDYFKTCEKFKDCRSYDGSLEMNWYEEESK